MNDSFLDMLNVQQREVVEAPLSNMLIIAGAGTGKTHVLVSRIAYIMSHYNVRPWEILVMTFTNKAAVEMQERLMKLMGWGKNIGTMGITMGTFHSVCVKILRSNAAEAMLPPNFSILSSLDQRDIIKSIFDKHSLDKQARYLKKGELSLRTIVDYINEQKMQGLSPACTLQLARKLYDQDLASQEVMMEKQEVLDAFYAIYQMLCEQNGCIDFSDMIFKTLRLLKDNLSIRQKLQKKYRHIFIDEFQDTSSNQYQVMQLLKGEGSYVFAVGDDDQSIYGWRGAKIENLLRFKNEMENVQVHELSINYRSHQNILNLSNKLISFSDSRIVDKQLMVPSVFAKYHALMEKIASSFVQIYREKEKSVGCMKPTSEKDIQVLAESYQKEFFRNQPELVYKSIPELQYDSRQPLTQIFCVNKSKDEGTFISSLILLWHSEFHIPFHDIAVLYRNNALSAPIEEALNQANLPYHIYGGQKFYERKEIKDVFAYLKLMINPKDNQAFERSINTPRRGIGNTSLVKLEQYAEIYGLSLFETIGVLQQSQSQEREVKSLVKKFSPFYKLIQDCAQSIETKDLHNIIHQVIQSSGLYKYYEAIDQKNVEATRMGLSKVANLNQLIVNAGSFEQSIDSLNIGHLDEEEYEEQYKQWLQQSAQEETVQCAQEETVQSSTSEAEPQEKTEEEIRANRLAVFAEFIRRSSLIMSNETNGVGELQEGQIEDNVQLMTIHASKGLEFGCVIVIGFEENILPSSLSSDLDEERRLAYVALTRAKNMLVLEYTLDRPSFGEDMFRKSSFASSFIDQMTNFSLNQGKENVPFKKTTILTGKINPELLKRLFVDHKFYLSEEESTSFQKFLKGAL